MGLRRRRTEYQVIWDGQHPNVVSSVNGPFTLSAAQERLRILRDERGLAGVEIQSREVTEWETVTDG